MENINIGILYICTGKYERFFKDFYESAEKFFLEGSKKTYYVWTDSESTDFEKPNVIKMKQKRWGWPYDTLMRFKMFLQAEKEILNEDYLFFFNANMKFLLPVGEEILPTGNESGLAAVLHSTFWNTGIRGTFENRSQSTAYVPSHIWPDYFQGCLFGGKTDKMIELFKVCEKNVDLDLDKGIIAAWWDESHMNKYFIDHPPKKLHPGYAYPEMLNLKYEKLILQLEKAKIPGGHSFLRS
jgi:hypothetical protein